MDFEKIYQEKKLIIENNIYSYLPSLDEKSIKVYNAMRYSLEAGGKRLRPVLLLSACEFCDGDIYQALPYACAIEMIHTYSLIHDDLPSMDNDDFRRGKPSNHKVYGEAIAILAGDGLLNTAMEIICIDISSSIKNLETTTKKVLAASEIFEASGCKGMIGGQAADIDFEKKELSEDVLNYIHIKKTSALLTACIRAGAILGNADEEVLADLTEFAKNMGLAFQIIDDILDVCGNQQLMGKAVGSDAKLQKMTYPSLYGIDNSKAKVKELEKKSLLILDKYKERSDFLKNLLLYLTDRSF